MPGTEMTDIELSIIILCYCSGETITDLVGGAESVVRTLTDNYEFILVGNYIEGNSDSTREVVTRLAAENARYKAICLPKAGMMGWDMRLGLEAARGRYLCVIDGDGQFPLESIARCYYVIKTGEYDLVKTYRDKRHDGPYRKTISLIYNIIFSILFPGLGSRDINSKPKMLTRSAYQRMEITSDDWFVDAEIMLNVRKCKMAFHEFPVEFGALSGRASFVRGDAILEFMKNLIRYRINEFREKKDVR
jgi:glycosyltransferase involved in cell wall biosynthesis